MTSLCIRTRTKPKFFVWDSDKEKRPKKANTKYLNDKNLNEEKNEGILSVIECLEEVINKDWRIWDTGKKNRTVKRSNASFSD